MKRGLLAISLVFLVVIGPSAQALHTVYIPFVISNLDAESGCEVEMGLWNYLRPAFTQNLITNPSFEPGAVGWTTIAGAPVRNAVLQMFGAWSYADGGAAMTIESNVAASALNETIIVSMWVNTSFTTLDSTVTIYVRDVTNGVNRADATCTVGFSTGNGGVSAVGTDQNNWTRCTVSWTNTIGAINVALRITTAPNFTTIFLDAAQLEIRAAASTLGLTTYCDGDQGGCEWLGGAHVSASQRSAMSKAGGEVIDFSDLNFDIEGMIGAGKSPITLNVDNYAILPGGELNSQKANPRPFTLTGWVKGTSLPDLHDKRQALIRAVMLNSVPSSQPITLRYTGATITKEIEAFYQAGLEGRIRGDFPCLEQSFALRFLAADPDFYSIGEAAVPLDSNDSDANRRNVAGRLRSTGQWDTLGPPNVAGTYNDIKDIQVGDDGTVYFGGDFLNFDNIAVADYIVSYDPFAGTWAALTLGAINGPVFKMAFAPNGDLYAVGAFINSGGPNGDFIAYWDGAVWNNLGNPDVGATITSINDLAFASNGDLYVVGVFTSIAGVANTPGVAMWDGAAWNALGTPGAGTAVITAVDAIAIDSQDNVYVGGTFLNFAGDVDADYIAMWSAGAAVPAWSALVALNQLVASLIVDNDDTLYLSGQFTDAGGDTNADFIAAWNRESMRALGTGLDANANRLALGPDGVLYAAGTFTIAGGLTVPGVAQWNGSSWARLDFTITGGAASAIQVGPVDPVVGTNYDIWLGLTTSGTIDFAGIFDTYNNGTEDAYPRILITRTGGTSATLYSVRSETLGLELLFAYDLLDGETLTINLKPTEKSIDSNFWGPRPGAILPNSDFGVWHLRPSTNDVTCFVDVSGAPTIEASMIWFEPYWSAD